MSYTPRRFNDPVSKAIFKVVGVLVVLALLMNLVKWLVEQFG